MKIWIERFKNSFFIHFSEPTHVEDDAGWYSLDSELEFFPSPKEQKQLKHDIEEGQVAEFELTKCWEPVQ